uniref:Uncharacterized protein n=1 Tax=Candidatus Kentrum sp. FW TaxID=2126338 RepID=A0A450TPJ0_9GAMM|nr:MAG: hypothetical protein BECKFW1821B_GA0114236_11737 [Candidatus Kentron sp. FW]
MMMLFQLVGLEELTQRIQAANTVALINVVIVQAILEHVGIVRTPTIVLRIHLMLQS